MVDFIIIITTGDSVRDQVEVTSIDAAIFPFRLINFHLDPRPWNDLFKIIKYSSDTLPSHRNTYIDPSKTAVDSAKLLADYLIITMLLYIILSVAD